MRDPDLDLIVNLSIIDDTRAVRSERVRLLILARNDQAWRGELDGIEPAAVELYGGQLRARAGATVIELAGDSIVLRGASRNGAIAFDLKLTPRVFPSLARGVAIGGAAPINWLVVPRLSAAGTVVLDGIARPLNSALAYHDHNWGHFTHHDFTWQWGHAHDGREHTVVLSRLLDRAQSTCHLQTLMLWRGSRIERIFRGSDLAVRPEGFLRPSRIVTLPRLSSLLACGATEVPQRLEIEAVADGDMLHGRFTAQDLARVVVPESADLCTTIIHEVAGRLELQGSVGGAAVQFDVRAIFELLRGTR